MVSLIVVQYNKIYILHYNNFSFLMLGNLYGNFQHILHIKLSWSNLLGNLELICTISYNLRSKISIYVHHALHNNS